MRRREDRGMQRGYRDRDWEKFTGDRFEKGMVLSFGERCLLERTGMFRWRFEVVFAG
jgi:hypothetical protein